MDGVAGQIVYPILGIVAAAAATFYAVSFMEIREVRFFAFCSLFLRAHADNFSVGD